MNRQVVIRENTSHDHTLRVEFVENNVVKKAMIFWNYNQYAYILGNATSGFLSYGILPPDEDGFRETK